MEDSQTSKPVTIVVPAFNEAEHLRPFLEKLIVQTASFVHETIVVDDGSVDRTADVAEQAGARVVRLPRNRGYGAALKQGIRSATTDYVMTIDGDGQHLVEDAMRLWERIEHHDMVVGERTKLVHSPLWRMPGKWMLGWMAQRLTGQKIPDLNCGLRIIKTEVARRYLHICPSGFSFSTTMTMALLSRGYDIMFVPIDIERRQGSSTVSLMTGFQTLVLVLRIVSLFDPLRLYIPASGVIMAAGIIWSLPYVLMGRGVSVGSLLLVVTAILIFSLGLLCDQISSLRLERYE